MCGDEEEKEKRAEEKRKRKDGFFGGFFLDWMIGRGEFRNPGHFFK